MTSPIRPARRTVLKTALGAVAAKAVLSGVAAAQDVAPPPARPREFDFLNGDWRIANRRLLASGGWDRTARLWDVAAARERAVFAGHRDSVWSVAFSPDGRRLATGSLDRTALLWDVR